MPQSSRLGLPYLAAAQAQKHVTVNETLLRLDALTQLSALSASTLTQPASPVDGDIYLLPGGKSGAAWSAMADGALAYFRDGVWEQLTPKPGWRCFVEDEKALYARTGVGWSNVASDGSRRLVLTPGGDGVVSVYRIDTTRTQNPRTAAISARSGDLITLTTADAGLFFNNVLMANVSYVRIWNTSKTPNEPAWIKAQPASNQVQVVDSAAIASWSAGETIQIGDPTSITPNRFIALDISPMLQSVLGRVFRQSGALCKMLASGNGVQNKVDVSENGATGSNQPVRSFSDGAINGAQNTIPCSVLSPISNSNLVFVQETVSGANVSIAGVSVLGVYV